MGTKPTDEVISEQCCRSYFGVRNQFTDKVLWEDIKSTCRLISSGKFQNQQSERLLALFILDVNTRNK
jgi:hypothetical protein